MDGSSALGPPGVLHGGTGRLAVTVTQEDALAILDDLSEATVVTSDTALVRAAEEKYILHTLSLWDALILEAAGRAGCAEVVTADMNAGQTIDGVTIIDPFLDP